MNDALKTLRERGYVDWCSDEEGLNALFEKGQVTAYVGFDPTADSLHVGHLIPLMGLAWLQKLGHRPILLAGGGTGMIGDPSMKSKERNLLSDEQVRRNVEGIKVQLSRLVDFDCGSASALLVNNYDWLGKLNLIDFLRDVGKFFSVNYMIRKEHVRSRIEDPNKTLSYTEFTYTLLQAYDFWHLFKTFGCRLQMGGNDQQGNLVSGIELIRKWDGETAYAATNPLLLNSSGTKFGKTEGGAVWLSPEKTSPYKFYQFWMNSEDDAVEKLLKLFTFLPLEEIDQIVAEHQANPGRRAAQRRLALEITSIIHGEEAAKAAQRASEILFGGQVAHDELTGPMLSIIASETEGGSIASLPCQLAEALVASGACASKGEVKRLTSGGGLYLNGDRVETSDRELTESDLLDGEHALVRLGKKKYFTLRRPERS
ncbi:tyrosine--tRNA ligase [Jonquetella anthropi]|uniref:tyrosine--tRNA ligase n=1 Tax=Jonquetella anthropi TaxID=428712 RepID=UPI0023F46176|nr:tyrosine--tRNA ligase [Jonquetella anthropi]